MKTIVWVAVLALATGLGAVSTQDSHVPGGGNHYGRRAARAGPHHGRQGQQDQRRLGLAGRSDREGPPVVLHVAPALIRQQSGAPGGFYNKTQGTPFYTPDPSRPAYTENTLNSHAVRLTWQASQKNKFGFFGNLQNECNCKRPVGPPPAAAEAQTAWHYWPAGLFQGTWTMPVTTRLLLQAGGGR